jgi:hypothetical protein
MASQSQGDFTQPQPIELIPDSSYQSRRDFVRELAYRLWEQRGCPLGSADIDWFAAEQEVYTSLVASGMITEASNGSRSIEESIYRT